MTWGEGLAVEVLEEFAAAGRLHLAGVDRASREARLWVAELAHVRLIQRAAGPARAPGISRAERTRRWRAANPAKYAAHRETHNTNRRAKDALRKALQ